MSAAEYDTRERLLRAAMEQLWERSYQSTSVDELCNRAQAKKGSFYHFFPSKTDLAIAAARAAWEQTRQEIFEPIFGSGPEGLAQLRRLVETVDGIQRRAKAHGGIFLGCPFGNLGQEMAHQDERLRLSLQEVFDAHCAYLEGALERAATRGEIPPGDARQRARKVFAYLEGALLLAKVANDPEVFHTLTASVDAIAAS